jgi:outer membrane protein TolC
VKRTAHIPLVGIAVLLLSSCSTAVRPTLSPPPLENPAAAAPVEDPETLLLLTAPATPTPLALPQGPLSLDEAVSLALNNNPDAQAAAARIAEAEAKVGEATSAFYPQVGARLGYARTDNPAQAFAMILNQRRFTFDLDFNNPGATQNVRPEVTGVLPLFNGGKDYHNREATVLGVQLAKLQRQVVRNALTDAVIGAYYALVAAPEQEAASHASVEAVTSALEQTRAHFGAGSALKSDVLSLEVRLAEAREGEVRAENGVELSRAGLRTLLALPPEAPVAVAPLVDVTPVELPASFADALARATSNRPELAGAASQVAMREHEVKAEQAAYLPRVGAVGNFGNDSSNFELSHATDSWTFGVAAEIDLFSGFLARERVHAAEQRLDEARQMERKTRLAVESEVHTAFLIYGETRQRSQVSQAAVASAEEALRLVQAQYAAGAATITRYLEVEAARVAARSRAIAARYELRRAEASLQKAMGVWAQSEAGEA